MGEEAKIGAACEGGVEGDSRMLARGGRRLYSDHFEVLLFLP